MMGAARHVIEIVKDVQAFGLVAIPRALGMVKALRVSQTGDRMNIRHHDSDFDTVRQVFRNKDYDTSFWPEIEQRIASRYEAILRSGQIPIIVDAGANIGAASVWYARKYPRAAIVAIEPDPDNCALLRKNVEPLGNITPLQSAIGSKPGHVRVIQGSHGWISRTERVEGGEGLEIVTIDDACNASKGDVLFIAKVDIEGFELDLLSENLAWLDQVCVLAIETHDWLFPGQRTSRTLQQAIAARPFEMFHRGEVIFFVRV